MLAVEPSCLHGRDKELGAVCVLSGVGHRQETRLLMLEAEVLVGKLLAVDRFAASAVTASEVTALEHKLGDDAVEARACVAEAVLARRELTEVARRLWDNIVEESEDDAARGLFVDRDVEVDVRHGWC